MTLAPTHPLSSTTREALRAAGLDERAVLDLVEIALAEDLGERGDLTSDATVPAGSRTLAAYASRAHGVLAGAPVLAAAVESVLGPDARLTLHASDGDRLEPGRVVAEVEAPTRGLLGLERTSLNLLGHLCGIATATAAWADAVAGTGARVRDTRKTTPGLRDLEKYAVRCGGGINHRRGLDDAVLIKDNHVSAAGGVGAALDAVHARHPRGSVVVQVEVDDLDQLDEALDHGAEQVLLDNFATDDLVRAVRRVRERAPGVQLEASGGLTLARAAEVAATGVDFIAIGALTHSAPGLDLGLDALVPADPA